MYPTLRRRLEILIFRGFLKVLPPFNRRFFVRTSVRNKVEFIFTPTFLGKQVLRRNNLYPIFSAFRLVEKFSARVFKVSASRSPQVKLIFLQIASFNLRSCHCSGVC